MADNDDMEKIVSFMLEFRAAGRELVESVADTFLGMAHKIVHPMQEVGGVSMRFGTACDRVLDGLEQQISAYTEKNPRELYEEHGPSGRVALFSLLKRDGVDSIVRGSETVSERGAARAMLVANKYNQLLREEIRSLGYVGKISPTTLIEYTADRADAVDLVSLVIRRLTPS